MLRKLTTQLTMQKTEVSERTANISCSAFCKMDCNSITNPDAWQYNYQDTYADIQG